MNNLRENLKKARNEKGLTQKQVAEYLGITLRGYQFIESGGRKGSVGIWDKLEDILGVNQRILRNQIDQPENQYSHQIYQQAL